LSVSQQVHEEARSKANVSSRAIDWAPDMQKMRTTPSMKNLCYILDVNSNKMAEKWDDRIFVEFRIMRMVIKQKGKYETRC
jgi:hypothetical protein